MLLCRNHAFMSQGGFYGFSLLFGSEVPKRCARPKGLGRPALEGMEGQPGCPKMKFSTYPTTSANYMLIVERSRKISVGISRGKTHARFCPNLGLGAAV